MTVSIVFLGTSDFAVPILKSLHSARYDVCAVVTQPDRPRGRGRRVMSPPVKPVALELGIPVLQPDRIRTDSFYSELEKFSADLFVTAAYGRILHQRHLDIPKHGVLNVHASLLPKLRGGAPIHWSIIRGYPETGITIMKTDLGMDSGPVIAQKSCTIESGDTTGSLHNKLTQIGSSLLVEVIPGYLRGELQPVPQIESDATFAPCIQRADRLVDWSQSAEEIHRLVRGLTPSPGAITFLDTCQLKIIRTAMTDQPPGTAAPGTILESLPHQGLLIQTGRGVLLCEEVQPSSKCPMRADQLVMGRYLSVGDQLISMETMDEDDELHCPGR